MVFEYMFNSLMQVNPLLAYLVIFTLPALFIVLLPGKLEFKVAGIYWLWLVIMNSGVVATFQWIRFLFALVGGLAFGFALYRIFMQ